MPLWRCCFPQLARFPEFRLFQQHLFLHRCASNIFFACGQSDEKFYQQKIIRLRKSLKDITFSLLDAFFTTVLLGSSSSKLFWKHGKVEFNLVERYSVFEASFLRASISHLRCMQIQTVHYVPYIIPSRPNLNVYHIRQQSILNCDDMINFELIVSEISVRIGIKYYDRPSGTSAQRRLRFCIYVLLWYRHITFPCSKLSYCFTMILTGKYLAFLQLFCVYEAEKSKKVSEFFCRGHILYYTPHEMKTATDTFTFLAH